MVFAFSLIYNGNSVTNGTGVLTLRNFLDSGANFEVDVYPRIIIVYIYCLMLLYSCLILQQSFERSTSNEVH